MKHFFTLALLVMMAQEMVAASMCRWQIDESGHSTCLSQKGEDEAVALDIKAKQEGKLPKIHEECKGRRTLSISEGVASFGCEE